MKFWKVLVVLALPYFMIGCCKCAKYLTVSNYTYCALHVENMDSLNNRVDAVSMADTIDANHFGIRVDIEGNRDLCMAPTSIFNSAYACKCPLPNKNIPIDSVTSITITTINDFDVAHSAGDTITSYFRQFFSTGQLPIDEYGKNHLTNEFNSWVDLETFQTSFDTKLVSAPSIPGNHAFRIDILMSDNRLLSATSKEVYLK